MVISSAGTGHRHTGSLLFLGGEVSVVWDAELFGKSMANAL